MPENDNPHPRSRYSRDESYSKPIRLTQRDLEILRTVGDYRLLTASQLQKLFFGSINSARKRLFELWQHKLLDRRFQPVMPGEGSSQIIYTLSQRGTRHLIAREHGQDEAPPYVPFTSHGSSLFIEHTLRRNDFRLCLTLACRNRQDVKLLFWRQDLGIKETVTFIDGESNRRFRRVSVLADGFFGLEHQGRKFYYFVEIDRATVGLARMRSRYKGYYSLWLQKKHLKRFGIPSFRVLTVTTTESRMGSLRKASQVTRFKSNSCGIFLHTTFDKYDLDTPEQILSDMWKCAALQIPHRHSLLGRPA